MEESKPSIFSDRRGKNNRRNQNISIPSGLDRREERCGCRRNRSFNAIPWWLSVDYAEELISEKLLPATPDTELKPKDQFKKK
ncbi:hypothetical protein [Oceanicoccus sp. KOV_DT_Chl]|uniref:hypothetical protein n=1 Tax=Oceanicoccus sp. KOV_DT_Chl TaxID=1904639 RepID=UPI000C7B5310|nr:hypothetical protein [Oceanicoccus sp. KOV_DT_Chl]